jgi:hypothetical protein
MRDHTCQGRVDQWIYVLPMSIRSGQVEFLVQVPFVPISWSSELRGVIRCGLFLFRSRSCCSGRRFKLIFSTSQKVHILNSTYLSVLTLNILVNLNL